MQPLIHPLLSERAADAAPTLDERLRYVDLCFEAAAEARRRMPGESGFVATDEALPPRNHEREALIQQLRIEAVLSEGLPLTLLGGRDLLAFTPVRTAP